MHEKFENYLILSIDGKIIWQNLKQTHNNNSQQAEKRGDFFNLVESIYSKTLQPASHLMARGWMIPRKIRHKASISSLTTLIKTSTKSMN